MKIRDYQDRAKETAIYPEEFGKVYLVLGMASEIGEVAGQVKRFFRDDVTITITDERREKIAAEIGDVMWYQAMLAVEYDVYLAGWWDNKATFDGFTPFVKPGFTHNIGDAMTHIVDAIAANRANDRVEVTRAMRKLSYAIYGLARTIDMPLSQIAAGNIEKLADRAQRDVLKGAGDER